MKNWPTPKYQYGEKVKIVPLSLMNHPMEARVVDLHFIGMEGSIEYDVVYYDESKQHKIRVFEDELTS